MARDFSAHRLEPDQLVEQWSSYKIEGDLRARDRLIVHYQTLVQNVASRVAAKLPPHVDKDDLVSYGSIGLMDAIEKFDLDRGLKFETYAPVRISGQIFDELRKLDWIPRSVHTQVKEMQAATHELEVDLQRRPTNGEVAEKLGITASELSTIRAEQTHVNVLALDAVIDTSETVPSLLSQLQDRTENPGMSHEVDGVKFLLARAIYPLPEREAIVLTLYYFENLTLFDIGQLMGVTESRVCQMHTRAMQELRGRLAAA